MVRSDYTSGDCDLYELQSSFLFAKTVIYALKFISNYSEVTMSMILTSNLIEKYLSHMNQEEKSKNTIQKYSRDIENFMSYLGQNEITKEKIIEYKNKLISEKYSPRSINSILASINSFLRYMNKGDCAVKNIRIQRQIYCPEEKELTKSEYKRLLQTAKQEGKNRLSLIIQTICSSGIRVSELEFITFEAVKCGKAVVSLKGKTRHIFIVKKLRKILLKYATSNNIKSGPIFITRTGKNVSRTNVWREMKQLCTKAKVNPSKVYPHNLRHLFAKIFYNMQKDIVKLADVLGHSSINTTRIYIISTGYEHRRQMENMNLIL